MKNRNALIIIAKYPANGAVKTRINGLSDEQRVDLYSRLLNDTMAKLSSIPGIDTFIAYAPDDTGYYFSRYNAGLIPLSEGDLGNRMYQAFQDTFKKGYEKISLVGADIPDLTSVIINESYNELTVHDIVFGPAIDGGYYLIGMKKLIAEVFTDVPWSADKTLEISIKNAKQAGYSIGFTYELSDVDTYEDAQRHGLI
ncbi:MAG: TIGR04282 family arsenosugar biosynthesis glycosyltransferase [Nitrospiraceae bacterium]|nr:MAG: TIGR04282 family arsenosugar biosynthesis glycosyltransferase [Nitrospiraceae bacterium]